MGESSPEPSAAPMSQWLIGLGSPARPMPVTVPPARVPARLSQKTLLKSRGLLKTGDPAGSVACRGSLFSDVESPAGAGTPVLVTAVAVVRFFITVLL